jgi:hypothetical protein
MRYTKSFLAAFVLALAAFASLPTGGGTASSSIIFVGAEGEIEAEGMLVDSEGRIVAV